MADSNVNVKIGLLGQAAMLNQLRELSAAFGGIGNAAKALSAPLTGLFALDKLKDAAGKVIETGHELYNLSLRTRMAVSDLVVLQKVFRDLGIEADSVASTVAHLQKNIYEAASKGGEAGKMFRDLGLNVSQLSGMGAFEQFQTVADAISNMGNATQKTATAMSLFGKAGKDLIPLFDKAGAIDDMRRSMNDLPGVFERNAKAFKDIDLAISAIKKKPFELMAGVMDMLAPNIQQVLNFIKKIDFVEPGKKFGAFVLLMIDYIEAGKFGWLLNKTIEAGFEMAEAAVDKFVEYVKKKFSAENIFSLANLLKNVVSLTASQYSMGSGVMATMLRGVANLSGPGVQSMGLKAIADQLDAAREGLKKSAPYTDSFIDRVFGITPDKKKKAVDELAALGDEIAAKIKAINAKAEGGGAPKGGSSGNATTVENVAEKIKILQAEAALFLAQSQAAYDAGELSVEAYLAARDKHLQLMVDIEQASGKERNDSQQLIDLTIKKMRVDEAAAQEKIRATDRQHQAALQLQAEENALKDISQKRNAIDAQWWKTTEEKRQEKIASLQDEIDRVKLLVDKYNDLAQYADTAAERQTAAANAEKFRGMGSGLNTQLGEVAGGPNPNSVGDQILASMTRARDQIGTIAQQIGQTLSSVIQSAIDGIANSIEGLIMGTMTWADALRNIGMTIVQSLVQAIAKMFAQWIVGMILKATIGRALQAASLAAAAPIAAGLTAIWSTPATLATIASYGAAAAAAPAEIAAAEGLTLGSSLAMFAEGGFTGAGGKYDPAGIVHRGEFVMPANAVNRIGVSNLEAMRQGGDAQVSRQTQVIVTDNRRVADQLAQDPNFETVIMDMVTRNRARFGVNT